MTNKLWINPEIGSKEISECTDSDFIAALANRRKQREEIEKYLPYADGGAYSQDQRELRTLHSEEAMIRQLLMG